MAATFAEIREKIEDLILSQAPSAIPGPEKRAEVVKQLSRWLDDQIRWGFLGPIAPVAEALDGKLIEMGLSGLLDLVVQETYDRLKAAGRT